MIEENFPLHSLTAFNIGGNADYYSKVTTTKELVEVLDFAKGRNLPVYILGCGSNMLVSDNGFRGLVLQIGIEGIQVIDENDFTVTLQVGAGEQWDAVVALAVENNWWGIENMSHIPGSVGAVPVQNVGAYGQEASDVIQSLSVYDTQEKMFKTLMNDHCYFRYRKSVFNTEEKGRYIILTVRFILSKESDPNLGYPDLKKYFENDELEDISIIDIRNAVISIRDNKLPLPSRVPNAGSFFKNVLVNKKEYDIALKYVKDNFDVKTVDKLEELKNKFTFGSRFKIPTAFLIDICGLKGYEYGGARISETHALNVQNPQGRATSDDVLKLAQHVRQTVYKKTGFIIDIEPELVGFTDEELNNYCTL